MLTCILVVAARIWHSQQLSWRKQESRHSVSFDHSNRPWNKSNKAAQLRISFPTESAEKHIGAANDVASSLTEFAQLARDRPAVTLPDLELQNTEFRVTDTIQPVDGNQRPGPASCTGPQHCMNNNKQCR